MNASEYHRQELELRISRFDGECDQAINNIKNLRIHARNFLETMPCDRTELKNRFLWCTRQLDEFMYLVTEFNLSVGKFAEENYCPTTSDAPKDLILPPTIKNGQSETNISKPENNKIIDSQKVQVTQIHASPLAKQTEIKHVPTEYPSQTKLLTNGKKKEPENWRERPQRIHTQTTQNLREPQIIHTQTTQNLREPQIIHTQTTQNLREPQTIKTTQTGRASRRKGLQASRTERLKEESRVKTKEDLMQFSSVSCSSESFAENNAVKDVTEKNADEECDSVGLALPPQSKLDAESFSAWIASADAANLWLVTDLIGFSKLVTDMTAYYNKHEVSTGDVAEFSCCAYFDDETESYFRAIYIKTEGVAEVILVDTGECRPLSGPLRPLEGRFCNTPALAHCCHLADVDLADDEDLEEKQATFLSKHLWEEYRIELHNDTQDNSSESQGVYVYLDNGATLNELLARELASSKPQPEALPISNNHAENKESQLENRQSQGSKQDLDVDLDEQLKDELDYGPEHENPLEAVTVIPDIESQLGQQSQGADLDVDLELKDELDYGPEHENPLEAVTVSPDIESQLGQQSQGADLDVDLELKDELDYGPEHENPLEAVTVSPDIESQLGQQSQGADLDVDLELKDELDYGPEHENPLEAVTVSPDIESQLGHQSQGVDLDVDLELKDELDYGPEHDNPLEAVTGYCNRDEMDICKHYDGGPDRTCFKGSRCKKRHVLQHPDGWTLDRVPVVTSCRPAKLPVPGTNCKVKVTHVRDVGCFFVQFEQKEETMTLAELVEDMTRSAADAKPLKILPALGELVSARFTDGRWYRARVTSGDDELGTVEVIFIDYGNESSVKLTEVLPLESRWLALPIAAVRSRLAGVTITTDKSVTEVFKEMVLDLALPARVIARSYDELTLELFDLEGYKVCDQIAVMADVPLQPYKVEDDSKRISLHIPA